MKSVPGLSRCLLWFISPPSGASKGEGTFLPPSESPGRRPLTHKPLPGKPRTANWTGFPLRPATACIRISALFFLTLAAHSQVPLIRLPDTPGTSLATPLRPELLDPAHCTEFSSGVESPLKGDLAKFPVALAQLLSLSAETPSSSRLRFGETKSPGPRHLRLAFSSEIPIGSVLVAGSARLSVLKPSAAFPGDPDDESQWLPAERLSATGVVTSGEIRDPDALTLWNLPPAITTRALRLTHLAEVTDTDYAGQLGGLLVLPARYRNESSAATASASVRTERASRILNGLGDDWDAWDNQDKGPSSTDIISPDHPEWLTLTWEKPVRIDALLAIWAGVTSLDVETYRGPETRNPRDAEAADWQPIARFENLQHRYAAPFWPNGLPLPQPVTTRALRLKLLTAGEARSHATNNGGRRTWLGEVMALGALESRPLAADPPAIAAETPHPPIAIPFHLAAPGYVSLVIERPDGFRVRNLLSETWFPAGDNVTWWDGSDDLTRDADAAEHGVYRIPSRPVAPGEYRVRGVVRGEITPRYEFSVYAPGSPPWPTDDNAGGWLANHTPPQAALFVPPSQSPTGQPAVYLGCYVTEGPSGLAWVDLEGNKLGGKKWLGGNWTAAPFLARDAGPSPSPEILAYAASVWESAADKSQGELRITALTRGEDRPIVKQDFGPLGGADGDDRMEGQLGGLAVFNQTAVASAAKRNCLLVFDTTSGNLLRELPVESPRGLAFDSSGALMVLSEKRLLRYPAFDAAPTALISKGLEDPAGITLDPDGLIYISDHGRSHQVKVFAPTGRLLKTIGKPGAPQTGVYDSLRMNHPFGLAVDSNRNLWVTERDYLPKRVSVWSPEGKLLKAFYGPGKYGGGGMLDPRDPSKFIYAEEGRGTLEFTIDWKIGTSTLTRVLYRQHTQSWQLPPRAAAPEQVIYAGNRRYFTNSLNSNPTGGAPCVFLFLEKENAAHPIAGMGRAGEWPLLRQPAFLGCWPEGVTPGEHAEAFFCWSDANGDFTPQPQEIRMIRGASGGITVMPDLSFCVSRLGGSARRFSCSSLSASGIPAYDLSSGTIVASSVADPRSSGGDQLLTDSSGWSVLTLGVGPFDPFSICGTKDGVPLWSYPNLWPGLHASHNAPRPDRPGEVIGATRLPGGFFEVPGTDCGPLWALHTNHGIMDLFTRDGIFVASLFRDMRGGRNWKMPVAQRGMDLTEVSLGEENFWPTLTTTADGRTYLADGNRSAVVRLDGLDSILRLAGPSLTLTAEDLAACSRWQIDSEATRQQRSGSDVLRASRPNQAPVIDGDLSDWSGSSWADIDKTGVRAYFNSDSKPHDITAALSVSKERLYVAWRTSGELITLKNSGEMPLAPFKTGDALDLMLGPDGERTSPIAGDLRLLVTLSQGKPRALIYRAVVPGTPDSGKVPFSSPWRTITFDQVEDLSADLQFATKDGNYEISLPLDKLGPALRDPIRLRGDIGILRGDGTQTLSRAYWNNKATAIISDVPDEAALTPRLWGIIEFK